MFSAKDIMMIQQMIDSRLKELGVDIRYAEVAEVSGNSTDGYYAKLYLDGSTTAMSAPVRCLRHYTPVVGHRVSVVFKGNAPKEVQGRID